MRRSGEWWQGLPRVVAPVDCLGARHTVGFERGELTLQDHDVEAERTLRALGSTSDPQCVQIHDAWHACFEDVSLQVSLGSFGTLLPPSRQEAAPPAATKAQLARARTATLGVRLPVFTWAGVRLPRSMPDMPAELRWALGAAIARRPMPMTNQRDLTAHAKPVGDLLLDSLITHVGSDDDMHAPLLANRSPLSAYRKNAALVLDSPVQQVTLTFGADATPSANVWFSPTETKMVGSVSLRSTWLSTVFARGICGEGLVLDVLAASADERRLTVRAGRWEGDVLEVRTADMTFIGSWRTRWLDD